jgi:hypothetical protein
MKSCLYHLSFGAKEAYVRDNGSGLEQAYEPHKDLRVPDADKSLLILVSMI